MKQKTVQILSAVLFLGLLFWGGYSLLSYMGVPVHGLVLVREEGQSALEAACPGGGYVCRGLAAFFPALSYTIARAAPFAWYAVLSLIAFILFLGWRAMVTGEFRLRVHWRPWHLLLLFFASVWLLFTVFGAGTNNGLPVSQIVEPTQEAYGNIGENAIDALKRNFQDLQERGCLTLLGKTEAGVSVYSMRGWCMQQSFFTRVVPQLALLLVFFFELLVLGRFLLRLLRVAPRDLLAEVTLSAGLGACGWVLLLWLLAVSSLFTWQAGWVLAVIVPFILFRQALYWLSAFFRRSFELDVSWSSVTILLFWLLLSYFALNFLTVVRPFPIGWDDLGSYLNRPRLLVSYGHLISTMGTFQWEYLTSLGFLLFGYDSVFGATAAMLINWFEGVLAVLVILVFARAFLGKHSGLLSALLYYSLPLVGHFSFADMKIDNAVFALAALAVTAVFLALFPPSDEEGSGSEASAAADPGSASAGRRTWLPERWQLLVLGGIFAGFAFSFKATAAMAIMALLAVLLGVTHWSAFLAGISFIFYAYISQGALNVQAVAKRIMGVASPVLAHALKWVFLALTVALLIVAVLRKRRSILPALGGIVLFIASIAVTILPWLLYNNIASGRVVPALVFSPPNTLNTVMDIRGNANPLPGQRVRSLPPDLKIDPKDPACSVTGGTEELDRYWGFSTGWMHYFTLPWRTVLNIDSAGYYVTTAPALLLFLLLLLLPFFWTKKGRWLRWLFLLTLVVLVQWMFLGNGIPWYGIGIFLGLVVGLEALIRRAPDVPNRALAGFLIGASLFIVFANRFWQFEQQRNLLEYPLGKISAEALRIRTIPYYDEIRSIVTERNASMPDRPYLYRVGTFIPYFIPRNLEVIGITDHQLDVFNCLNQERKPEITLQRLKALGFNSIVFDTNTSTIEKDPNGSLHKKVQEFIDFLNAPSLGLQVLINDSSQGVAFILIP